jgi:hypothetical protein
MPTYVFGFGSLINMKANKELDLTNKKICPVMVSGLKRMLNVSGPLSKHRVFGVKNAKKQSCNGVLFAVSDQELASLVKREKLYEMKRLRPAQIHFPYTKDPFQLMADDQIICFYPQTQNRLPKNRLQTKPISNAYLTICLEGAVQFGPEFLRDFYK